MLGWRRNGWFGFWKPERIRFQVRIKIQILIFMLLSKLNICGFYCCCYLMWENRSRVRHVKCISFWENKNVSFDVVGSRVSFLISFLFVRKAVTYSAWISLYYPLDMIPSWIHPRECVMQCCKAIQDFADKNFYVFLVFSLNGDCCKVLGSF